MNLKNKQRKRGYTKMYARHDLPTDVIAAWLTNDSDHYYFAQDMIRMWLTDDSTEEIVETDLEAYIRETLDEAPKYSYAGRTREQLSDADLDQVNWTVILGHLEED